MTFIWLILANGLAAFSPIGDAQDRGPVCRPEPGREAVGIRGEVTVGQRFEADAGRFVFRLTPDESGWHMGTFEAGRAEDLSRLTPPLQTGRKTEISGWQFRNADNTGPNDGTVNAPQERRELIFSPEVGRTIGRDRLISLADVERVKSFGRGELTILDYELSPPEKGTRARFLRMKFEVCMSWPKDK